MDNKQSLIIDMSKNKYINDFNKKNKLDNTNILNHFYTYLDSYESIKKCESCSGLKSCKQDKQGEIITLNYDGTIFNEITYCDYCLAKMKEQNHVNSFVFSDIPANYNDLTLESINLPDEYTEQLCALCFDILDGKRNKGLYIFGDLGVGKTYMSIALANSLVNKGKKVAFIKSNYFINNMRKLVAQNNGEYENIIDRIQRVSYLFIDDIGSETVSSYSRDDLLFKILDYRMENKLTTIFTSNLSKEALEKTYSNDKNDNTSIVRAKRLIERIDILTDNYVLKGNNKRRN